MLNWMLKIYIRHNIYMWEKHQYSQYFHYSFIDIINEIKKFIINYYW